MDYEAYLIKIITTWTNWCEHHKVLRDAIVALLVENQSLKVANEKLTKENEKLKRRLRK